MAGVGEKRIPESYIVILQPTVTPYEMLSSVLKGYKPTFTYGSIFTGFAVDRVPMQKADEVSTDFYQELYQGYLATGARVCTLVRPMRRGGLRAVLVLLVQTATAYTDGKREPFL